jgi:heptaprenyl diphosphate synthase
VTLHSLGFSVTDPTIRDSVLAGMARVESGLRTACRCEDPFIDEAARYLVEAGGKRFRPLMTLLAAHCGQSGGAQRADVIAAAVVCELTHLATLYHDDVMDEATVRRGAPSPNTRWGNTIAILTGDFLFSRASNMLADLGPEAVRLQARTFERLVMGQIHETEGPRPGVAPVDHYLSVLADKTGSLIATAAEFGANFAGADPATTAALRGFAEQYGLAFQISDDILDVTSESAQSGKTPGTDLREGVPTLPVLFVLAGTDPAEDRLRALVRGPITDDAEHAEALRLLRRSPAIDRARAVLADYAAGAQRALGTLHDERVAAAFESLVAHVISRTG